jgi:hypothetical protein
MVILSQFGYSGFMTLSNIFSTTHNIYISKTQLSEFGSWRQDVPHEGELTSNLGVFQNPLLHSLYSHFWNIL